MKHRQKPSDISHATLVVATASVVSCAHHSLDVERGPVASAVGCAHHIEIISLVLHASPSSWTRRHANVECRMPPPDEACIFLSLRHPWTAEIDWGLCMSLNRHQVWTLRIALGLKIWSGNIRCFLPHRLCSTHRLAGVGQGLTTSHFSCTKIIANIGSGLPASPLDKTHRSVASIVACANNSASSIFYFPYYPWPAHNGNPTSNMGYVHQP